MRGKQQIQCKRSKWGFSKVVNVSAVIPYYLALVSYSHVAVFLIPIIKKEMSANTFKSLMSFLSVEIHIYNEQLFYGKQRHKIFIVLHSEKASPYGFRLG